MCKFRKVLNLTIVDYVKIFSNTQAVADVFALTLCRERITNILLQTPLEISESFLKIYEHMESPN